jgi:glyceraldehyde-3-phosphate dehydrogenase (ferredoxin)
LAYGSSQKFSIESDSMHNADIGVSLMDAIIGKVGILNLDEGARKFGRRLSREKNKPLIEHFLFTAFGRKGWMVPNQYWTPGVLSPMPIMGKYYMHYGNEFMQPRQLGRLNAERFKKELILDNLGICRFHRTWAEDMIPEIIESLYGMKDKFMQSISITASRINSRNASVFWESGKSMDFIYTFLKRKKEVEKISDKDLIEWIERFELNKQEAALTFWYEIHKGIHESLREF